MEFSDEVVADVTRLEKRFSSYQGANAEKASLYDGKYRMRDLGISLPPGLPVDAVVGWPGTVVDVLEERLSFEGWSDDSLQPVYQQNDLDVKAPMAHLDGLLYGTAFATVTKGGAGEPDPVISIVSPREMVVSRDTRSGLVSEACRFVWSEAGDLVSAVLYRPNETVWLRNSRGWTVEDVDEHRLNRVPVAQLVNKPRASKVGGRSEITPAVRGYTHMALRTLVGAEVAREFYSVPQRWMMGAPESFFLDENGEPRGAWDAMMGKIMAVERDEETGEVPQVGSFAAHSMSPFFEQIRNLSQLLSAETSIPPTYLGFVTDNPSSADAIRMAENRLVKRAEQRQAMFGKAWTEVARLSLMIRDGRGFEQLTSEELAIRPLWRDAATPTKAAATDQATKLVSIGFPVGDYIEKMLGLSATDKEMLERDRATSMREVLMQSIRERAAGPGDPVAAELAGQRTDQEWTAPVSSADDPVVLRAKADAMGVMIRAGVKAESAAKRVGLDGLEFWDGRPATLRYDD